MAYTLTFDNSVYCQVNGSNVDSPYTLTNGDVITVTPNYGNFVVNNKTYSSSTANAIDIADSDITITKGGSVPAIDPQNTTINFSEATANRVSVDMSTLSGWANLAQGSHTLTVKAKADGYGTSDASTGVAFTKGAAPFSVSWVKGSENGTNTAGESGSISTLGDYGDTSTATFTCSGGTGTYTHTLTKVSGDSYCTATQSGNVITVNMGSGTQDYVTGEYTLIISSGTESITYNISYGFYCLTGDTLITLDNGTQKRIDQLTLYDKVLSYNPDTMQLEADEITYTDSAENKKHTEYDIWTFSDGTLVKTVHRHRLYNVERQAMVYMDEWNIGEHAVNINDEYVELVGHENVKEEVRHYTLFTKNQNYFVNGLLSGNRHTKEMHL